MIRHEFSAHVLYHVTPLGGSVFLLSGQPGCVKEAESNKVTLDSGLRGVRLVNTWYQEKLSN